MVHRTTYPFVLACALAIGSVPLSAEVMSVGPSGFVVKHEVAVKASPGVVYAAPGKAPLRMTGTIGPLQASGLAGSMTWELAKTESGTNLVVNYGIGGYMAGGFEKIAPLVDAVLGEQVGRFKAFVETGNPVPVTK